jgi:baseplate J-like protein
VIYTCCYGKRAEALRAHPVLNGIEFLEVLDEDAPADSPRQRTLLVRCFKPVTALDADNVRIEGGTRIRPVNVTWAFPADVVGGQGVLTPDEIAFMAALDDPEQVLVVRTDVFGDFSTYTLRLVAGLGSSEPPTDYDPVLSAVEFSFKAECPTPFDCLRTPTCPPAPSANPLINYLAKDYGTLRQALLDRMALLVPAWTERHAADVGVALVELLAYVGDSLSYQQDAIATEAYLHTARRRTSARRHARLVDYFMHDGGNARAWIQIDADIETKVPRGTQFLTRSARLVEPVVAPGSVEYAAALSAGSQVFEALHDLRLFPPNNLMNFYTWGDTGCVLPKCATRATLRDGTTPDTRLLLVPQDVLVFEEAKGPATGKESDADPTRRHAVRLTKVEPAAVLTIDADGVETWTPGPLQVDPLTDVPIVHIEWSEEDALPFPLCVSSPKTETLAADDVFADVSVARGNVLLADHGRTLPEAEAMENVPFPSFSSVPEREPVFCEKEDEDLVLPRYRPLLAEGPVTQVAPFDPEGSAASAFAWELRRVLPAVEATSDGSEQWTPVRDLLDSTGEDRHFVVEVEGDGSARLRFGDTEHGRRPQGGSAFEASYRVGNGTAGNVGRETLAHLVDPGGAFSPDAIVSVRNPLPAAGGVDAETIEEVRQKAPYAFRTQERAVTTDDYVAAALRRQELQGAAARFRWTGSWRTVFVTLDPQGRDTGDADAELKTTVRDHLEKFRLAGYDLVVDDPIYVSLEMEIHVCVDAGYFAADVESALRDVFSSGFQLDGSQGLFHPDRFRFGEPVYLSPLVQAALAVDGVHDVRFTTFQRAGQPDGGQALADGRILLDGLEVARLANDPNFPEHGVFSLTLEGGQ